MIPAIDHHGGYGFAVDTYLIDDSEEEKEKRFAVIRALQIMPGDPAPLLYDQPEAKAADPQPAPAPAAATPLAAQIAQFAQFISTPEGAAIAAMFSQSRQQQQQQQPAPMQYALLPPPPAAAAPPKRNTHDTLKIENNARKIHFWAR